MTPSEWLQAERSGKNYGNSAWYLVSRLTRDRPDLVEKLAQGEIRSGAAAAREAGIPWIRNVAIEDRRLVALLDAWKRADLTDRQVFLWAVEDEMDAALAGRMLESLKEHRRSWRYLPAPGVDLPDLEALADRHGVSGTARLLGVSPRTVIRWRTGKTKPSPAMLTKIADHRVADAPLG